MFGNREQLVVLKVKDFKGVLLATYWNAYPIRNRDGTWRLSGWWLNNESKIGRKLTLAKLRKVLIMTGDAARLNRDLERFKVFIAKNKVKKIPTPKQWFDEWIRKFTNGTVV